MRPLVSTTVQPVTTTLQLVTATLQLVIPVFRSNERTCWGLRPCLGLPGRINDNVAMLGGLRLCLRTPIENQR